MVKEYTIYRISNVIDIIALEAESNNILESVFVVLKSRKRGCALLLVTFRLFHSFRSVPGFTTTQCSAVITLTMLHLVFKF